MSFTTQELLGYWNQYTREAKEVIDNSTTYPEEKEGFAILADVQDTNVIDEKFVSIVGLSKAQKVPELSKIPQGKDAEGYQVILSPEKMALSLDYSYEYLKGKIDSTQKLEEIHTMGIRDRLNAIYDGINTEVFDYLNFGFTDVLSPDGQVLFSNSHRFTDASNVTFDNLLAAVAPSKDVLREVTRRARSFVDASGKPMPLRVNRIHVKDGGAAHMQREALLGEQATYQYKPAIIEGVNNGVNEQLGKGRQIIPSIHIESEDAYYFSCDYASQRLVNPIYVGFHDRPTISDEYMDGRIMGYSVNLFTYFKSGIVNVPIGLYGSVGA